MRWRFACPKDHRQVSRVGNKRSSPDMDAQWWCETCREHHDTVTDLKTGCEVSP